MGGLGVVLLAAVGVLASKRDPSKVMRRNYGGFKPVVGDRRLEPKKTAGMGGGSFKGAIWRVRVIITSVFEDGRGFLKGDP